jgi:hypothetical protein
MLSGIGSLNYKDGELCTAHLIIRKLVRGGHALTTCETLSDGVPPVPNPCVLEHSLNASRLYLVNFMS